MEQLENALIDDDDRGEMPSPSVDMVSLTKTPTTMIGASCLVPLPLPHALDPLPPRGGSWSNCDGVKRKEK